MESVDEDYFRVESLLSESTGIHFNVFRAATFTSAIEQLSNQTFEAVLVDSDDAPQAGINMIRDACLQNLPTVVVLYTGRYPIDSETEACAVGIDQFLSKNEITPWQLARTLRDAIERKQIERKLQVREQELDTIMDGVPALISYIDAGYRYRRANRSYARWFDLEEKNIIGRHVRDILGESTWQIVEPFMTRALDGETVVFETELPYVRGGARWVQVTYTPDRSLKDSVTGFVVHVVDVSDRIRMQRDLAESHLRAKEMARLPEENPNPVARIGADGLVLYCNEAASVTEWACVQGRSAPDRLRRAVHRAVAQGQPIQDDIQFGERTFSVTIAPFPDDFYANVYGRDITDRLKAEKVLRRSELLYRAISRSIPDAAVWVVDHDLRILIAEGELVPKLGYKRGEIEGRFVGDTALGSDSSLKLDRFRLALEGSSASCEHKAEGIILWSHYTPLRDDTGAVLGAMALTLDVTLRKNAEARLLATIAELQKVESALRRRGEELELARTQAENEQLRLEALFEALPVGVVIVNSHGALVTSNLAFEQIWSAPQVQLRGFEDFILFKAWWVETGQPISPDEWAASVAIRTGESVIGQRLEIERFDGIHKFIINSASPIFDASGEVVGSAVVVLDVSDLRQAELALQAYTDRLRHSNETLRDFAFSASHDLQEPLRKVSAFGALLNTQYAEKLDERGRDYVGRMINAAERMQAMIDGLLIYSRVMTQGHPFSLVDLKKVGNDVIADLDVRLALTQGQVEMDNLPIIEADPVQMHQLLLNLVGNALKFHKPGQAPHVVVGSRFPQPNVVEVLVSDNGIGLDQTRSMELFQPFKRLHGRSQYDGNGMGLAICRKIAERHSGTITVESVPGEGSTFIVRLPLVQSAAG